MVLQQVKTHNSAHTQARLSTPDWEYNTLDYRNQ